MTSPFDAQTFATLIERGVLQIGDGHRAKLSELGGDGPIFLRAGLVSDDGLRLQGADRFRGGVAIPRSKFAEARDTFVTTKGNSIGRTGYISAGIPHLAYSPHLSYWRSLDRETLHPEFLRYWAKSPAFTSQLHAMAHGTDMAPYLSLVDQKRLVIELPTIREQRSMASVLGTLDDKIESNRRLAGVLEETAATLFRARFADFVGVREFEESEIGRIPRGWSVQRIDELADINAVSHTARLHPEHIRYVDISSVAPREIREVRALAFGDAPSRARRILRGGDTIISTVRPERRAMAFIHQALPGLTGSTGFAVVSPRRAAPTYVYRWVTSNSCIDHLAASASGSAYPAVNPSVLASWRVPVPPDRGEEFEEFARPLEAHKSALAAESGSLAELRDALLPKLITGQIRVPDTTDPAEVLEPTAQALAAAT